tara:strand:- start:294 stop:875 length:582 start_codon:yes stop_codon:yes gene_type:complete
MKYNLFKNLLIKIILIIYLTPSYADDIRDFQIEGISVGDSLLKFYSKNEIKNKIEGQDVYFYKNKKFADFIFKPKTQEYENLQITINPNDYNIHNVAGQIWFVNDMPGCQIKKKKIISEILLLFSTNKFETNFRNHAIDKTGDSKVDQSVMKLGNGDIVVECYDWSKKYNYTDKLIISIRSTEFKEFLMNAYD